MIEVESDQARSVRTHATVLEQQSHYSGAHFDISMSMVIWTDT